MSDGAVQPARSSQASPGAQPDALVQAQHALAMLEDVLESMSDGFFAYDVSWRLVRVNRAGRRMLETAGLDPDAVLGRVVWEAVPGLEGTAFRAGMLRAARERVPVRFEAPGPASGRWVETTVVPVAGGVAAFSHDIGERMRAAVREHMLVQAGALLSHATDIETMLRDAARIATREFCDACVVTTVPHAGGANGADARPLDIVETSASSPAGDALRTLHSRFPLPADAAFGHVRVIRTGQSQLLQAGEPSTDWPAAIATGPEHMELLRRSDQHSVLVVPLAARDRTYGAITFIRHSRTRLGRFDGDDLRSAEELGKRAAMAVDNMRLFEAERAARSRAERLQDLATALSAATTFDDVADAILTQGMALVGATGGRVIRPPAPGEHVLHVTSARGWSDTQRDPLAPIPLDAAIPSADAVVTGRIIWVRYDEILERYPSLAPMAERGGHRTWIAVPFRHEGRTVGAVGLALPDERPQSEEMLALLRTMAHQCTQAIERIRLYEEAEAARQEAERERADLTTVLDVTPIGIGIARDRECTDIRVNPAFARQLGIPDTANASKSGPDAGALPFRVLENGRELEPYELPMQRAARENRTIADLLVDIVHADGRVTQLLEYAAPLLDDHGRPRGAVGAFVDVTERARLLDAERDARREAEIARAEAEAASQAKSDFLAMMSHELRTPLNAIAGYVEILEMGIRGPLNEKQVADLQRIRSAQSTLLRRIDDVLSFARLEAGHVEFELETVSISEIISDIEPLIAPQVAARSINYVCEPCESGLVAIADAQKASQVLLNLVANAVKFTPEGGTVTVAAEAARADDTVVVTVRDTGVGIPADKIERIFDPFMQVDTRLTREHGGTGLGLAISRDLMRGMGGDLSVESVPGAGSVFRMKLPAS